MKKYKEFVVSSITEKRVNQLYEQHFKYSAGSIYTVETHFLGFTWNVLAVGTNVISLNLISFSIYTSQQQYNLMG